MQKKKKDPKPESIAGTYVFDKKLGKVVKVSDHVPGVSARSRSSQGDFSEGPAPCGKAQCDGMCPGAGGGFGMGAGMGGFD